MIFLPLINLYVVQKSKLQIVNKEKQTILLESMQRLM